MRLTRLHRAGTALALLFFASRIQTFSIEDIFSDVPVLRVSITISAENIAKLKTAPRKDVQATVRLLGEVCSNTAVHLKGSTGSFRGIDEKPSLTLSFSKFAPGHSFRGIEKVHLNNSVEDPSYMNEELGAILFRKGGIPTPRVAHAIVQLNGRDLGLYVIKEGFTGEFLRRHFSDSNGNLYDIGKGHDVDERLKRHCGSGPDTQEDLRSLAAILPEADLSNRWRLIQSKLDVDRFITFMVLEIMLGHRDGYCLARNNFRIYHDPASDKLVFLPAGMDQLFGKSDAYWKPHMAGIVAKAIVEIPEAQKLYSERYRKLLNEILIPENICAQLNLDLENIRKELSRTAFEGVKNGTEDLCHRIEDRRKQLDGQLPLPPLKPLIFQNGEARFGDWKPFDQPPGGGLGAENAPDGKVLLAISAGPITSASWRTTALLKKGHYRFEGKAMTVDVAPLPFGNNQGARLRVWGRSAQSQGLRGTEKWVRLELEFEVKSIEEEVELICELRASSGKALYDRDTLKLMILR